MAETVLNVVVDSRTSIRLAELAASTGRDAQSVAAEAIEAFLDVSDWQGEGVCRGIASLDAGQGVPHEDVRNWVESWGSESELPRPVR